MKRKTLRRMKMPENTTDLQGDDWFSKLKNPQGQALDTSQAEGLTNKKPENVDIQQPTPE